MKIIKLNAREAAITLSTLVSENLRNGLYLHHAEAGEQIFYTDIEDHLASLADEAPVSLVFYTESELIQDTVSDAIQFTSLMIRQLPEVANGLYAGQGSVDILVQLGEALAWLQEVSKQLTQRGLDLEGWPERLYALTAELVRVTEGNSASEQADFLLYELQGALDGLLNRLTSLVIPGGGTE